LVAFFFFRNRYSILSHSQEEACLEPVEIEGVTVVTLDPSIPHKYLSEISTVKDIKTTIPTTDQKRRKKKIPPGVTDVEVIAQYDPQKAARMLAR
jgi:hypothetical protein